MTRAVMSISLTLAALLLTVPGRAADRDALLRAFRVTPTGLKPASTFSLKTLDGTRVVLADYRGRAVLLYFWATW
jgi:cytochrome oxidase Cu insertion factor (SCO1/SenC/PrrC family)